MQVAIRGRKGEEGATSTSYLFLLGIILAIITMVTLVGCAVRFFSAGEVWSQTSLMKGLDVLSRSGDGASDSMLTKLEESELIIFFDRNSSGTVSLLSPSLGQQDIESLKEAGVQDFAIADRGRLLALLSEKSYPSDKLSAPATLHKVIFLKPESCGSLACAQKCTKMDVSKPTDSQARNILSALGYSSISGSGSFYLASCKGNDIKIFDSVGRFIIKPKVEAEGPGLPRPWEGIGTTRFYFSGAALNPPLYFLSGGDLSGSQLNEFGVGAKPASLFKMYYHENPFSSGASEVRYSRDFYVSAKKVGDDIVMCLDQPCLSAGEQGYYNFKDAVYSCINTGSCDALSAELSSKNLTSSEGNKITFAVTYQRITIKYGDGREYSFPYDANLRVVKGAEAEAQPVQGVSLTSKTIDPARGQVEMVYDDDQSSVFALYSVAAPTSWKDIHAGKSSDTKPTVDLQFIAVS